MSSTRTYAVSGMTCAHCVAAVTEEVEQVVGVTDVAVDLDTGRLTLAAEPGVADEAVRAAVEEAGYELENART
jgi:copper chaperone